MPSQQRIEFVNSNGHALAAALALPDREPAGYVLFAHCFTCGKNIAAASRLSRTLVARGFGVFRFDFTGIGNSDGDFANTDFASNVDDLLAATDFMRTELRAPEVMIGHSLGGTAVLAAAGEVAECRAVVTIGSPMTAMHVVERLGTGGEQPAVTIGDYTIDLSETFVSKYTAELMSDRIGELKRALLVMHAPFDDTVSVDQAGEIFTAAKHPKSFISLDDADHLLTRMEDVEYVASTVAAWASRFLNQEVQSRPNVEGGAVHIGEANQKFLRQVSSDNHVWLADEPKRVGGGDLGPDPYEHLLASLGTCTSMTIRMYANRKKWPLTDIDVVVTHRREHLEDCEECEGEGKKIEVLHREITFAGDLSAEQTERLMQIADRCPVHRTLEGVLRIETSKSN